MSQNQTNRIPRDNNSDPTGGDTYQPYIIDRAPVLEKAKEAVKTAKKENKKKSGGCGCW